MQTLVKNRLHSIPVLLLSALSLLASSCRSTQNQRSRPEDGIVESNSKTPATIDGAVTGLDPAARSLGNGWDTELQRKLAPCVETANYVYRGAQNSELTVMRDYTYDQIMEQTGGGIYGKASLLGLVSAKVEGDMATSLASTDDSTSYIYNFSIMGKSVVLGDRRLNVNGSSAFNTGNLVHFRDECGNQFVDQVKLGGQLYIGVKYTFASKETKEQISLTMSLSVFWGLIKIHKTWTKEFRDFMKNVRVSLEAFQIGGDPRKLEALKNEIYHGSCAGDEPDACAEAIDKLLDYGANEFSKQMGDMTLSDDPNAGPAIIDLSLDNYSAQKIFDPKQGKAVVIAVSPATTGRSAVTEANAKLQKTIAALKIAQERMKTLKEFKLSDADAKIVDDAARKISEALTAADTLYTTTCTRAIADASFIDDCLAKARDVDTLAKAATVPVSLTPATP